MASKIVLDLKNFRHHSSDKNSTTLVHKTDGHKITLHHPSLSPESQTQLKMLSPVAQQSETPIQADEMRHNKMAKGGSVSSTHEARVAMYDKMSNDELRQHQKSAMDMLKSHPHPHPLAQDASAHLKAIHQVANAGGLKLAEGGEINTDDQQPKEQPQQTQPEAPTPDPEVEAYKTHAGDDLKKYIESGFHKAAEALGYNKGGPVQRNPKLEESKKVPPKPRFEEGGTVSDPDKEEPGSFLGIPIYGSGKSKKTPDITPAPVDPDKGKEVVKPFQAEGGQVRSLPEVLECVKNAYAQGGEVAVRKMYAEGDQVAPPGIQAHPPDIGGVQPTLRGEFNPKTPTSSPEEVQRMKVFDEYNRQAPGPAFQFGPNGEPPQRGVNTKVLEDVSGKVAQEDRYQAEEAKEAQQSVDQANMTLAKYNLPLQNQPNGLPTMQAPGQQTGLPTLDQPPMQQQPADAGQPTPMPKQDDMGMGQFQNQMQQGMNEQLAGIKAGQQAQTQIGAEAAQSLKADADNRQQAMSAFQHNFQQLEDERQAHIHDIQNGYIDPDQYWQTHSKVAAGIGMILAGFNPTSHPNAAINFLQSQLERNMQAQAQNLGAKNNLLAANLHQFGNLRDAQDMTRIMQNDAVQHQLQLASANAASPAAKAAALQASGELKMKMAPVMQNFALRRAVMGLANGGGTPQSTDKLIQTMMMYNPEEGKMLNAAYVPGVGISRSLSPVPEADRNQILAMNVLDNKGKDLLQFARAHKNDFGPNTIKIGAQKAAEMVNYYNQSIGGGVLTEGKIKWLDDQISRHPTSVFQDILGNNAQLEEIINSNSNRRNMLLQKNNIPVPNQQQPQQPKIKTYGGHKYMRGPNGEPVRVD
jgi:hypothetical protein